VTAFLRSRVNASSTGWQVGRSQSAIGAVPARGATMNGLVPVLSRACATPHRGSGSRSCLRMRDREPTTQVVDDA
jgi:hypothetical protein